jgi:hypothetical protein
MRNTCITLVIKRALPGLLSNYLLSNVLNKLSWLSIQQESVTKADAIVACGWWYYTKCGLHDDMSLSLEKKSEWQGAGVGVEGEAEGHSAMSESIFFLGLCEKYNEIYYMEVLYPCALHDIAAIIHNFGPSFPLPTWSLSLVWCRWPSNYSCIISLGFSHDFSKCLGDLLKQSWFESSSRWTCSIYRHQMPCISSTSRASVRHPDLSFPHAFHVQGAPGRCTELGLHQNS